MRSITKLLLATFLSIGITYTFATPRSIVKADSLESVDRHISNFSALKVEGPFDVHITQGDVESVKFSAPASLIDRIVTEVDGGVLEIRNKHDNWGWSEKSWYGQKSVWRNIKNIVVYVTVKNLNSISTSGRSGAYFEGGITTGSLKLRVRGSGVILGKIEVKKLRSSISGSGNIKISGNAENSAVKVTGSGNFTAPGLITLNSAVRISGSGDAKINANDRVDATISGSGGVSYTGTAKIVKSTKSGSGNISRF